MTNPKKLSDSDLEKIRAAAGSAPRGDWSFECDRPSDGRPPPATIWVEGESGRYIVATTGGPISARHLVHAQPENVIAMVDELLAWRRGPEITWEHLGSLPGNPRARQVARVGGHRAGQVYQYGFGQGSWKARTGRDGSQRSVHESEGAAKAEVERLVRESLGAGAADTRPANALAEPGTAPSGAAYPTNPAPGRLAYDMGRATARLAQWKARTALLPDFTITGYQQESDT